MAFDGSRAKLRRANVHLDEIERRITTFIDRNPHNVVVERDSDDGRRHHVRIADPPLIPSEEFALIIGDFAHNVRGSLDYMIWELSGSNPSDTQSMFPIFEAPTGWRSRGKSRIQRVPLKIASEIERMQPYHAQEPRMTSLNAIRLVNDADKHRLLTVTAAVQDAISVEYLNVPAGYRLRYQHEMRPNCVLDDGAVLMTAVVANPYPDMRVTAQFTPAIAFGESVGLGLRAYVLPTLRSMLSEAKGIVDKIEQMV